jgi:hypothetical protein
MCSRLVEYPGPEKEQAKGLLRDLRSRGKRYAGPSSSRSTNAEDSKDTLGFDFEFSP